ncbi:MAG TPA: hypothetical protein VGD60_02370 [Candidatus Acidoferrales bacterium]
MLVKRVLFALAFLPWAAGTALSSEYVNYPASATQQFVEGPLFKLACLAIFFSLLATVVVLAVINHDPELQKRSGLLLLKQYGVALIFTSMLVAVGSVCLVLGVNRFSVQLVAAIVDTCVVFIHVFCDVRSRGGGTLRGFSLERMEVRQKLPLLLFIHGVALAVIVTGVAAARELRPQALSRWHTLPDQFDLIMLFAGFALLFAQVIISRITLARALEVAPFDWAAREPDSWRIEQK